MFNLNKIKTFIGNRINTINNISDKSVLNNTLALTTRIELYVINIIKSNDINVIINNITLLNNSLRIISMYIDLIEDSETIKGLVELYADIGNSIKSSVNEKISTLNSSNNTPTISNDKI